MPGDEVDESFAVSLPPEYWTAILACLEPAVKGSIAMIEDLKKAGRTKETLTREDRLLAAPWIIRDTIVRELAARGHIQPEAADRVNVERLINELRKKAP